ncbi:mycothiol S-conjugate amidase [Saccharopolyspora kobensis]|uniref:Mycothiol S-conjugate amidase n=1 Tax=Saccharopolyspora kobensis TaxID=146035 RepID=A0A1H5XY67_9PSEU|nr:mycothiol conjugate amidase Mca [Saccharopolyspora kobensis]SEG16651.1 mycothiol S-conjugate amidase [Saccharopolyspora kobensis]SFF10238.1 mycothiol S-conjugate amidase [Saccharopolyspora kobensis]
MTPRLMSVHAHPDDESSKGAATLAHYAAAGAEVLVVTCTGGERGDVLNPALDRPEIRADIAAVRRREMAAAAEILGVRQRFLGFTDSGLPADGEPLPAGCFALERTEVAAAALVAVIREFRPHVVITYDESGGYPHPDHIKTHEVTVEAFDAAGDPHRYSETGTAWRPLKLYYQAALSRNWFRALHEAMLDRGVPSLIGPVLDDWPDDAPELEVTTRIRCPEHFATRDRAALAHATQMGPDSPFFAHPRDIEREVWPTEDYHLARSAVPTSVPEHDLFAGISSRSW